MLIHFRRLRWGLLTAMMTTVQTLAPMIGFGVSAEVRASAMSSLAPLWSEPISEGVTVSQYVKHFGNRLTNVYVAEIDLTNPYAKIVPLYGQDGVLTKKQTVLGHAESSEAVVAVNADFFHLQGFGTPLGPIIDEGEVKSAPGVSTWSTFGVTEDDRAVIAPFNFAGMVMAPDGSTYPLGGVNKENFNPRDGRTSSHIDQIVLFSPEWGSTSFGDGQGSFKSYVELVVQGGFVREIRATQPPTSIPPDGFVLWGHGKGAEFLLTHFFVGAPVQVTYDLQEEVKRAIPLQTAVGSHILLVDQGRSVHPIDPAVQSHLPQARTAVGIDESGTKVWLVVAEKSADGKSGGVTLPEMADVLVDLGVWKAINLDGGGSSSMVVRRLGETVRVPMNQPPSGKESYRAVPTAIGVLNTAPPGEPKGLILNVPDESALQSVLAGDTVTFGIKAYDEHFHPYRITPEMLAVEITGPNEETSAEPAVAQGTSNENGVNAFAVRFASGGTYSVTARVGQAEGTVQVRVIGGADVQALMVQPETLVLKPGERRTLSVTAVTKEGQSIALKPHHVVVTVESSNLDTVGEPDGLTVIAGDAPGEGRVLINFDGFTATVPLRITAFSDTVGHWAEPYINALAGRGLVSGVAPNRFAPDVSITRAELAVLLAKAQGWYPLEKATQDKTTVVGSSFRDFIPAWAKGAVFALSERGVVAGYPDGTFRADRPVTRAELAVLLNKILEPYDQQSQEPSAVLHFADAASVPPWAEAAVARVVQAGVMIGTGNAFQPNRPTTRAEAATIMYKWLTMFQGSDS